MEKPRVVIDTNVLVSILKGSHQLSFIYAAFKEDRFKLVVNTEILRELSAVLCEPRLGINSEDIKELFRLIKIKASRIKSTAPFINVCRDTEDNFILELALTAKADIILTGDKDLLCLNPFKNIGIIPPKEFMNFLK